jgi:hypothetical protein
MVAAGNFVLCPMFIVLFDRNFLSGTHLGAAKDADGEVYLIE